jgi:hypothetical protein
VFQRYPGCEPGVGRRNRAVFLRTRRGVRVGRVACPRGRKAFRSPVPHHGAHAAVLDGDLSGQWPRSSACAAAVTRASDGPTLRGRLAQPSRDSDSRPRRNRLHCGIDRARRPAHLLRGRRGRRGTGPAAGRWTRGRDHAGRRCARRRPAGLGCLYRSGAGRGGNDVPDRGIRRGVTHARLWRRRRRGRNDRSLDDARPARLPNRGRGRRPAVCLRRRGSLDRWPRIDRWQTNRRRSRLPHRAGRRTVIVLTRRRRRLWGLGHRRCCDLAARRRRRRVHRPRRARRSRLAFLGRSRCGRRRSLGALARREQAERIDIPLRLRRDADAQVHVRFGHGLLVARADGSNRRALGDGVALVNGDRSELHVGHRVPVRGLDRDGLPVVRNSARERDKAARRGADSRSHGPADVDAAMLARRVRMGRIEGKGAKHRPVRRPRPRSGVGDERECEDRREQSDSSHSTTSMLSILLTGQHSSRRECALSR